MIPRAMKISSNKGNDHHKYKGENKTLKGGKRNLNGDRKMSCQLSVTPNETRPITVVSPTHKWNKRGIIKSGPSKDFFVPFRQQKRQQ